MKTIVTNYILLTAIIFLAIFYGFSSGMTRSPRQASVRIAAAASLKDVMERLQSVFHQQHPQVTFTATYAATGVLRTQLEHGAESDIFVSANRQFGYKGDLSRILNVDSIRTICHNSLVLAVKENPQRWSQLEQVLGSGTVKRIGIGDPSYVPAGTYAKRLLDEKNMWSDYHKKMVMGTNVRQVLAWLENGSVDAGFIYGSDLKKSGQLVEITRFDTIGKQKITYPIALTVDGNGNSDAKRFIDFCLSDQGQAIIAQFGFEPATGAFTGTSK